VPPQPRRARSSGLRLPSQPQRGRMLPLHVLPYLMNRRYCEVDLSSHTAAELFWNAPRGRSCVQAVCDWVHKKVTFGYEFSSPTRTALGVYSERVGVCRDFQHLAITFCRALNIPARYATGYLGDIGVIVAPSRWTLAAGLKFTSEIAGGRSRQTQCSGHRARAHGNRPRRNRPRRN
jgi:transglutaminase-like putative cysteine protease